MHDEISAADKLLRHLGGYKDRIEHTGPDGGPIEVGLMTDEERLDALRELIARVKARVAGETSL
jgi:phage terminase small subunit